MGNKVVDSYQPLLVAESSQQTSNETETVLTTEDKIETGSFSFRLEDLAYARSGDKGNNCNIGE